MRRYGGGTVALGGIAVASVAVIVLPLVAAVWTHWSLSPSGVDARRLSELLITTLLWCAVVAIGAMLIGWLPGRMLGRAINCRGFVPVAALMLVPICLPAYLVFYAWWQSWPAESALFDWAVRQGPEMIGWLRRGTLLIALWCWSWPLVAWAVAGPASMVPASRVEMLKMDKARWWTRVCDRWLCDRSGLLLGGLLVFVATFANTTCFDLAQVFTWSNEVRALEATGANAHDLFRLALPAIGFALCAAMIVWMMLTGRSPQRVDRPAPAPRRVVVMTCMIWLFTVALPAGMLVRGAVTIGGAGRAWSARVDEFFTFYGDGVRHTLALAAVSALFAAVLAALFALLWQDTRRWMRALGHAQAVALLFAAAVPGTLVGLAIEAAYNNDWPVGAVTVSEVMYRSPVVLVVGHLARFAFVPALLGYWLARREPPAVKDLRALDGANTLRGLAVTMRPQLLVASCVSAAIVFVLSLGEIPVTALVRPAGFDVLTASLLNDMHYQRPRTVMIAGLGFLFAALLFALCIALVWSFALRQHNLRMRSRSMSMTAVVMIIAIGCLGVSTVAGCSSNNEGGDALDVKRMFGTAGRGLGQFNYPRGIAVDAQRKRLFVVDKSARIQQFTLAGEPVLGWRMPEWENGKPVGLNVAPDGTIYVADTHYFRVMQYDAEGNEIMRFGEYGQGPGQFIFPTDVEFGPEGTLYVSEYGGNDRVQVFSAEGDYLFEFGRRGAAKGEFNRPQSMDFNNEQSLLYIADAVNHRVVIVNAQGDVQRMLGEAGRGPGELSYPYDLVVQPDGSVLVCEYGNNRVQHLSADGECLGLYGRGGMDAGELQYPWGLDATEDEVFILDSGNNRVQVIDRP